MSNKKALLSGIAAFIVGGATILFAMRQVIAPAPEPEPVAAAAPAVYQKPFVGPRSKEEARQALAELPELKAWSAHLEKSSGGTVHGALIEYGPTPKVIGNNSYWQFSYVENTPEAARRWESFLVGQNVPEILVDDDETSETLTLEQWRKEKQPLTRTSAL